MKKKEILLTPEEVQRDSLNRALASMGLDMLMGDVTRNFEKEEEKEEEKPNVIRKTILWILSICFCLLSLFVFFFQKHQFAAIIFGISSLVFIMSAIYVRKGENARIRKNTK